jgi:hypothetical protein
MMAMFCFLIRNHGKLYLPNWSLASLLSLRYRQNVARLLSENGQVLLQLAATNSMKEPGEAFEVKS